MPSRVYLKAKDYSNEPTRVGLYFPQATGANFDTLVTNVGLMQAAMNGVTLGDLNGAQFNAVDTPVPSKAASPAAQRELKWLVTYIDGTNPIGNGNFEIPMADTALLDTNGQDMDVSGGAGAALVTAIQTYCVSRLDNAVLVESIKLVGRNL